MNKLPIISLFFIFLFASLVLAVEINEETIISGVTINKIIPPPFDNFTGNVNSSDWWITLDRGELRNVADIFFDFLGDITITSPANWQFLRYDSGSGNWVNSDRTINETIDLRTLSIEFNATTIDTLTGNLDSGNLASVQIRDNLFYNVSEVTGSPGFNIQLNFTGVDAFNSIVARLEYTGNDDVNIQLRDCATGDWHAEHAFTTTEGVADIIHEVLDTGAHICGIDQNVSLRIIQSTAGKPAHDIFIDGVHLVKGSPTTSTTEFDPFALHKSGDVVNQGNQNWGGFNLTNVGNIYNKTSNINATNFNITADNFFGKFGDLISEQNPDGADAIRLKGTSSDVDVVLGDPTGYFSVWNVADNNAVFYVNNVGDTDIAGDFIATGDITGTNFIGSGANLHSVNVSGNGGNTSIEMRIATTGFINSTSWLRAGSNVSLANSNDNVGIGTDLPNTKLHILSLSGRNTLFQTFNNVEGNYTGFTFKVTDNPTFNRFEKGGIFFERLTDSGRGSLHFCNNDDAGGDNVEISDCDITLLRTGDVGIGTQTPNNKLEVVGDVNISGGNNLFVSEGDVVALFFNGSGANLHSVNSSISETDPTFDWTTDTNLMNWWRMDNVQGSILVDERGLDNGTLINQTTQVSGAWDKALTFDGDGDFVDLSSYTRTDELQTLSVSVWFLMDETTFTKFRPIVAFGDSGNRIPWIYGVSGEKFIKAETFGGGTIFQSRTPDLAKDTWYHLVFTTNATRGVLYLDGNQVNSTGIISATGLNTGGNAEMGAFPLLHSIGTNKGDVDEVMIFNRTLTPQEVVEIYALNNFRKNVPREDIKINGSIGAVDGHFERVFALVARFVTFNIDNLFAKQINITTGGRINWADGVYITGVSGEMNIVANALNISGVVNVVGNITADSFNEASVVLDKKGKSALDYFTTTSEERSILDKDGNVVYDHNNRDDIDLLLVKDTKLVCNSVSDGVDILGNPKMVEECVEIETESKSLSLLVELQRDAIYELKERIEYLENNYVLK